MKILAKDKFIAGEDFGEYFCVNKTWVKHIFSFVYPYHTFLCFAVHCFLKIKRLSQFEKLLRIFCLFSIVYSAIKGNE